MEHDPIRFIIITVPQLEIVEKIDRFRRAIAEVGDTWEALTYPPHITLRTGALVPSEQVEGYADRFVRHLAQIEPFPIETGPLEQSTYRSEGETRRFIGYEIVPSDPLVRLNRRLLEFRDWIKSEQREFWPHLTIAFHDLGEEGALRVKRWIEANSARVPAGFRWKCDNVALYMRGETGWEPFRIARF